MRRALIAAVVLALVFPAGALAAAGCPKTTVSDLEDEVMCQVCGVPLGLASDSPQAKRERAFIARLVARCESKPQIKRQLVAQFGPSVLADPPHKGFDVAAFLVPVLAIAFAAAALALAWPRRRGHRVARPVELSAADAARVDAELERLQL